MGYSKTILCLANSRKNSGRCIAGKVIKKNRIGSWIRPVSSHQGQEIALNELAYENSREPCLLDIINLTFINAVPENYQTENHLISTEHRWIKEGTASWLLAKSAIDDVSGPLWVNGNSSTYGINDRVQSADIQLLEGSLYLIRPSKFKIIVAEEGAEYGNPGRKIRGEFKLGNETYKLAITDSQIENQYKQSDYGEYPIQNVLLCLSLAGVWNGFAYKLIAGIIPQAS